MKLIVYNINVKYLIDYEKTYKENYLKINYIRNQDRNLLLKL